jgi:hypothetical protein
MQKYLVSYSVLHDGYEYRKHFVSLTNDLAKILPQVIGQQRLLKKYLQDYELFGRIAFVENLPGQSRLVRGISIRELPAEDEEILAKYLWPFSGR